MASAVHVSAAGSLAASRQFPQIDFGKPAMSFFKLIRDGKYQDSITEYGAKTCVKEYGAISSALKAKCDDPTFPDQTVAESLIERLLKGVDNFNRFKMARQIVLTMRDQGFETQFARMVEIIALVSMGSPDAHGHILNLLNEPNAMEFATSLAESYKDMPGLSASFNDLLDKMEQVADWVSETDGDAAPASFDSFANVEKKV
jgi:hypothetical protein